jgi:putrescine transport system ATP-binding protein
MTAARAGDENCFVGSVAEVGYLGGVSIYKIKLDNGFVMKATAINRARLAEPPPGPGDRVWLSFAPEFGVVLLR